MMNAKAKTTTNQSTTKVDIKKKVIDLILEACENERKLPWDKGVLNGELYPINPQTGSKYRGFNRLFLYWLGRENNPTLEFLTFKGAQALKGSVKKGVKSLPVVYWHFSQWNKKEGRPAQDGDDKKDIQNIPFVKFYNVFRISDTTVEPTRKLEERENASIEDVDNFINKFVEATKVSLEFKCGGAASYAPFRHKVCIAEKKYYKSSEEYYSTLFHELVHSTGKKMERKNNYEEWGDHSYSKEEVVAETGAMFLCQYFGIEKDTSRNSQAYLQHWSQKLRENPMWLISGANAAEKAVNYMLKSAGLTPLSDEEEATVN